MVPALHEVASFCLGGPGGLLRIPATTSGVKNFWHAVAPLEIHASAPLGPAMLDTGEKETIAAARQLAVTIRVRMLTFQSW
jgi:hypothetical protein